MIFKTCVTPAVEAPVEVPQAPVVQEDDPWAGWNQWADSRIRNALETERDFMIQVVGAGPGEIQKRLRDEIAGLKADFAKLRAEVNKPWRAGAKDARESGKVIDLPNPLVRKTCTAA